MQRSLEKIEISVTALYSQLGAAFVLPVHSLSSSKLDALSHVKVLIHTKWEPSHTHKTPPPYPSEFFVESANRLVNCKMGVSYEKREALPALNKANSLSMKPAFCAHSLLPLGLWLIRLLFLLPLCNII